MSNKFEKHLAEYLPLGDGTFAPVVVLESVDSAEAATIIPRENFRKLQQAFRDVAGRKIPVLAVVGAASSEVPVGAPRAVPFSVAQGDTGTIIPVSGTGNVTIIPGMTGFNAQLLRADAGTLTVVPGAGVTLWFNGATVANVTVAGKYNWIIVQPGLLPNEYILSRNTGA